MTSALFYPCKPKLRTIETIQREKKIQEQKAIVFKMLMTIIPFIFLSFCVFALAADPSIYPPEHDLSKLSGIEKFVYRMAFFVHGNMLQFLAESDLLTIDTTKDYFTFFKTTAADMQAVGLALGTMWVLLDIIDKAQSDILNGEILLKLGIKFIVMIIIISNSSELAQKLVELGNSMVKTLVKPAGGGAASGALDTYYNSLNAGSFVNAFAIMFELLIPGLTVAICGLLISMTMYGRIIECGVRMIFMPIGISDAFTHGLSSPGMRYIKKFFAVCIHGAVVWAIVMIALKLQATAALNGWFLVVGFATDTMILVVACGAILKSQQLINDIAGA